MYDVDVCTREHFPRQLEKFGTGVMLGFGVNIQVVWNAIACSKGKGDRSEWTGCTSCKRAVFLPARADQNHDDRIVINGVAGNLHFLKRIFSEAHFLKRIF